MKKKNWELLEILKPELISLDRRLDKSCKWVEKHRNEIHHGISFSQAVELHGFSKCSYHKNLRAKLECQNSASN